MSCSLAWGAIEGLITLRSSPIGVPLFTARVVSPLLPSRTAVISVEPPATPVARPGFAWPVVWIVATPGFDEDQLAESVTSAVELSL